jgi:predicted CxxxxCH...CXXCH cytochrome family protein
LTASSGTKLATGGHSIHIGATIDTSTCVKCHTYTGETVAPHVNGTFNVNYDASGCATNNCHASIAPPVWTAAYAGKDTCTKCHGTLTNTGVITAAANNRYIVAPSETPGTGTGKVSTTNAKVGAHETHLKYLNGFSNYSTVDYRCESCHGTLPAAGTHATGLSTPAFQNLATKWGAITTASFSAGTCSNTYCHNPAGTTLAAANNGTAPPPSWTNAAYIAEGGKSLTNCELCHKVPGTPSFSKQSAHGSMVTDSSANQCNACHGHNGDATGALGSRHVDGILYASGSCDTCHGYPPMTATDLAARTGGTYVNAKVAVDGGGGYHKKHLLPTIVIADGFTPCLPCHPSDTLGFHMQGGGTVTSANVNVFYAADTGYRFDSTRTKRYDNVAKKCFNISCHFKPISAWNL